MRILMLEDNPADAELAQRAIENDGLFCQWTIVRNRSEFEAALVEKTFDLILSDYSLPGYDGLSAMRLARQRHPDVPFILLSGTLGEDEAVESLKRGATDYVLKHRLSRLVPAVRRALAEARERTWLRKAEQDTRQSEHKYRRLFESLSEAAFLIDAQTGRIIDTNPQAERLLGKTRGEIVGQTLQRFHPTSAFDTFRDGVESGQAAEHAMSFDADLATASGQTVPVHVSAALLRLYDRHLVLALYRDTTEHWHAEEKIREQAALLDKAQDAICVTDLNLAIRFWNESARRVYGWTASEAMGQDIGRLLQTPQLEAAIPRLIESGEWHGELHQMTQAGQPLVVESRWTLVRDDGGQPKSILLINTDVTERKKLETQYLRAQRMESIGALAGGIAHDLNNLLAPILMACDLLSEELSSEHSRRILDAVKTSAVRGAALVKQVLSFARGHESRFQEIEIKHLVQEMINLTKETFPQTIKVHSRIGRGLLPVQGDAAQLHQVLMNLCVNARDAMPGGGTLTIHAENMAISGERSPHDPQPVPGAYVVIGITDTGEGIAPELQKKIFEPFFTTKEPGRGTGLGLCTARSIVKKHGGFLDLTSQMGKGTTVRVCLPAARKMESATVEPTISTLPLGQGEQILLVDDEKAFLEIARASLEAHNYRVLATQDGAEAVAFYRRHRPAIHLVITDLMMPNLDGAATIRALQSINPRVRIICVSGAEAVTTIEEAKRLKVQACLIKPYSVDKLLNVVREVLAMPSPKPASAPATAP